MSGFGLGVGWQVAASGVVAAVTGYTMLPVIFPAYTRRFNQRYSADNQPEDVDQHTLTLVANVLDKMKMPEDKASKLDVFITSTLQPQYHGSFSMRWHSLLGVPFPFKWRTDDDFENVKGKVFKQTFPWDEPLAENVKRALLLTDSEKEFVVARQLGYIDSQHVWVSLSLKVGFITLAFLAAHIINFRRSKRRSSLEIASTYVTCSIISLVVYLLLSDSYRCYTDQEADKYAATIGPEFSKAGFQYYNKVLDFNKALRQLLPGADKKFTVYGNEVTGIFRTKSIPLASRRDYMKRTHEKQLDMSKESGDAQTVHIDSIESQ